MFCEVFYNYNKRGNGKPFRVRDKIKLFQNMSFSEFTDQGFILFKQEALNHLAAKLSIDNDQESLVEKLKEANEPIYRATSSCHVAISFLGNERFIYSNFVIKNHVTGADKASIKDVKILWKKLRVHID